MSLREMKSTSIQSISVKAVTASIQKSIMGNEKVLSICM